MALAVVATPSRAHADTQPLFLYLLTNSTSPGGNAVLAWRVNSAGGLAPVPGAPFVTGGTGMATVPGSEYAHRIVVSRSRFRLFAVNEVEGTIAVFDVSRVTGALTRLPGSPFAVSGWGNNPGASLAVTPDGQFLYGSDNSVMGFSVATNGALTQIGATWTFSARSNGMVVTDANDALYLAQSDRVTVLSTSSNGLSPIPRSPLLLGNVPTDVAINHAGDTLYVGSRANVNAFRVSNGAFTPLVGTPYFGSSSNLSGLSLDPTEHALVVYGFSGPRLGSGAIAADGTIAPSSGSPFSPAVAPSGATFSPDGSMLFTSNDNGQLDAWLVDSASALTHASNYPNAVGSSGFSKLAALPAQGPTPMPALPLGATLVLALGLLSAGPSRRRRYKSCGNQSSGS